MTWIPSSFSGRSLDKGYEVDWMKLGNVPRNRAPEGDWSSFDYLFDQNGRPVPGRIVFNARSDEAGPDVAFTGLGTDGKLWLFIVQAKATMKSSLRDSMRTLNPPLMQEGAYEWFVRNPDIFGHRIVRLPFFVAPFKKDTIRLIKFFNSNLTRHPESCSEDAREIGPTRGLVIPIGTKSLGTSASEMLLDLIRTEGGVHEVSNIADGTISKQALWVLAVPTHSSSADAGSTVRRSADPVDSLPRPGEAATGGGRRGGTAPSRNGVSGGSSTGTSSAGTKTATTGPLVEVVRALAPASAAKSGGKRGKGGGRTKRGGR